MITAGALLLLTFTILTMAVYPIGKAGERMGFVSPILVQVHRTTQANVFPRRSNGGGERWGIVTSLLFPSMHYALHNIMEA